jgi:hypothetical protein
VSLWQPRSPPRHLVLLALHPSCFASLGGVCLGREREEGDEEEEEDRGSSYDYDLVVGDPLFPVPSSRG